MLYFHALQALKIWYGRRKFIQIIQGQNFIGIYNFQLRLVLQVSSAVLYIYHIPLDPFSVFRIFWLIAHSGEYPVALYRNEQINWNIILLFQ